MSAVDLHIGIGYSDTQSPISPLAGLQVYAATTCLPERVAGLARAIQREHRRPVSSVNSQPLHLTTGCGGYFGKRRDL